MLKKKRLLCPYYFSLCFIYSICYAILSCLIFLFNFLFIFVYLHLTFYFFCTNLCPYINIEVYIYLTCTYGDQSPYFLLLKIHCSQLFGDGAFHLPSTISKIPYQKQIVNFEFSKEMGSGF